MHLFKISLSWLLAFGLVAGCSRAGDKQGEIRAAQAKTLPGADLKAETKGPPDAERLAGIWMLDSQGGGKKLSWMESTWLHFENGKALFSKANGEVVVKRFLLEPTDNPKTLDFIETGGKNLRQLGIYKFEGDDLLISLGFPESPRPKSFELGSMDRYRRINAYEKAVLAGNSPADMWVKDGNSDWGWEARFPVSPANVGSNESDPRWLRLNTDEYALTRHHVYDETQKDSVHKLGMKLGKVIRQQELTPKMGAWSLDVTFQHEHSGRAHRVHLVRSNYTLYELRVGSSKEFIGSPDAQRFLDSFRIIDSEDKLPELAKNLFSEDRNVRKRSILALNNIDSSKLPSSENARKAIHDITKAMLEPNNENVSQDGSRRSAAYRLLEGMGQAAESAAPAMMEGLVSRDLDTRQSSVSLLKGLKLDWENSESLQSALPIFAKALACPEGETRNWVSFTLSRLGTKAGKARPGLLDVLANSPGYFQRCEAARLLAEIGAKDQVVYEALVVRLGDSELEVRQAAEAALRALGPGSVQELMTAATRDGWSGRVWAFHTLSHFGEKAKEAIPAGITGLKDRDLHIREAAATLLGKIGPAAAQATPELIQAVGDQQGPVRRAAAEALGRIGPAASDALPALRKMSQQPDPFRGQEIAKQAIALIQGK